MTLTPMNGGAPRGSETARLAPALLELFPERVMLSSRELSEVVSLERSGVAVAQLLAWARELCAQRQGAKISGVLRQLSQRAKRWHASHVGDKYQRDHESDLSPARLAEAADELITKLRRAEAELHEPKLCAVLTWVTGEIHRAKRRALSKPSDLLHLKPADLFDQLRSLDQEFRERVSLALPAELERRMQLRLQEVLEREAHRARPQDLILAQRAVYWRLLSSELGLPSIHLSIFDQW